MESLYIECAGGVELYRNDDDTLICFSPVRNRGEVFKNKLGDKVLAYHESGDESWFEFNEEYIEEVAKLTKAKIKGKNVNPTKDIENWDKNRFLCVDITKSKAKGRGNGKKTKSKG